MPTIVRKLPAGVYESRREVLDAISWQVRSGVWSPPTDVYETGEAYLVRVEIAGMRDEDFEVSFEDGTLLISGQRPDVPERRAYHQMEIRFGRFVTAVGIPLAVDVERARADYSDGFLTVTLPKLKSSQIEVK